MLWRGNLVFVASLPPMVFFLFLCLANRPRLECLKAGCKWSGTPSEGRWCQGELVPPTQRVKSQLGRRWMSKEIIQVVIDLKPLWATLNGIIFGKMISSTFSFCRLCHGVVGGNGAAFANTSSIHFKSSQRQKC